MKLTSNDKAIISKFVEKFPFPKTNDEESAAWTHRLCEQLAFEFPLAGWGHKSAGVGRPHSADVIALGAPFIGWDIISSAGSPDAVLNLYNDSIDLSGQLFEPVASVNHLDSVVEPPIITEVPNELMLLMQILSELKTQTEILKLMAAGLAKLPEQVNETFSKGVKIRF